MFKADTNGHAIIHREPYLHCLFNADRQRHARADSYTYGYAVADCHSHSLPNWHAQPHALTNQRAGAHPFAYLGKLVDTHADTVAGALGPDNRHELGRTHAVSHRFLHTHRAPAISPQPRSNAGERHGRCNYLPNDHCHIDTRSSAVADGDVDFLTHTDGSASTDGPPRAGTAT
ncbi:MAG: hypothetical protein M3069_14195 [Chloroflexota bacterium]|nr:hypothetical protein [Chloroflexota bacterium]